MPDRYDMIVVGAGPAGSLFSYLTARAGFKVLLLDKSFFPRPKVCGDTLNAKCWSIWKAAGLEDSFKQLPHHKIRGFKISSKHEEPIGFEYGRSQRDERAISREILDEWLRQQAIQAGAKCLTSTTMRSYENRTELITSEGTFSGTIIVGADGRNSWVARAAGLDKGRRTCSRMGWQTKIPAELADEDLHIKFFEEGYFGVVRDSETESNLCLMLDSNSFNTPQMIADQFFDNLPPQGWKSTFPISRSNNIAGDRNVLLLGDAARMVEPFTGEGIYMALHSAWDAANLCISHLAEERPGFELGRLWRHRHHSLFKNQIFFQNHLSRWLAVKPGRASTAVRLIQRYPTLLNYMENTSLPELNA
ncbi:MAG: FAD-dependent monooxygenase [Verrucomicrobiota bacterium]